LVVDSDVIRVIIDTTDVITTVTGRILVVKCVGANTSDLPTIVTLQARSCRE
jgi:hypothetical protein